MSGAMRPVVPFLALALLACGGAQAPSTGAAVPAKPPCAAADADAGGEPPMCTADGQGDADGGAHAHAREGHGDGREHGAGPGAGPAPIHMCVMGKGPLPAAAKASVERALAEERDAELLYEAALSAAGPVPPLTGIARAERRHSSALEQLLQVHGHPIPPPEKKAVAGPKDLAEACRAGVAVEKKNIAFYDKELAASLPSDVECVYEHLQHASRDHHLPAFQRCAPK
jgi:hypothetical protein